jgi:FemAB-related protein (PEP-CTERM system-associated)
MTEQLQIREIAESDLDRWDAFVDACEEATFFHRAGWYRVIRDSFGHRPRYLAAEDTAGGLQGILPLFEVRSLMFGHSLVSTPFCVYGGAVGSGSGTVHQLEDAAAALADELGVDFLELRYVNQSRDDWPVKSAHATFIREMQVGEKEIIAGVKNKQRTVIRNSLKKNFDAILENDIENFFQAYSTSVRNLGTPVFAKQYFRNLKREFGDACEILTITDGERLQSSLMSFYFRDTVLPYYGGGYPECRKSKAMDFMYFDLMRRSSEAGYRYFDFGRSKIDTGPYNYKRHWNFEPTPLHYQYHLVGAGRLPEREANNPKFRLLVNTWKRLPLGLSQRLGPPISKYLG